MQHAKAQVDISALRDMSRAALAGNDAAGLMHRLDCVLLVAGGRGVHEVAQWFGVGQRSVQRWVHAASTRGIEGLIDHRGGGRPPALTLEQRQAIDRDLHAPPSAFAYREQRWTGKRLALHLERCYAMCVSVRQCQRLIAVSSAGGLMPR